MPKLRHHHVGGSVTHTSLPAAAPAAELQQSTAMAASSPGCCTSPQRSAAAWAWFERGGSSACITPRKAEGLIIAVKNPVKGNSSSGRRPSRFRQEVLRRTTVILRRRSFGLSEYDDKAALDYGRRRHSFHNYDGLPQGSTSPSVRTLSSSARISTAPKSWSFRVQYGAGATKDEVEDDDTGNKDQARSSLLDNSEIEAVFMQLRRHLFMRTDGSACSAGRHKRYVHGVRHQTHLQSPGSSKSSPNHKILPDKQQCDKGDDHVVHRLLRLRSKLLGSSRRSSSSTIPALICSSISTADCIIDHHQPLPGSGNTSTALMPIISTSHLRPQCSKSHHRQDLQVDRGLTSTQHRHVLHQHVHHIHHHHYHHHLRGASLDTDRKGDVH